MKIQYWTPEEDKIIIDNYQALQMKEIQKFLPHRTFASLKHRKKILQLEKRKFTSVNEMFFDKPNLQNCMVAGFVSADGCVTSNHRFIINLAFKDVEFLKNIAKLIEFEGTIHISEKTREFPIRHDSQREKYEFTGKYCNLSTWETKKWSEDLNKHWNVTPRKTLTLQPPNINILDLVLAFCSGSIDGDGMITFNPKNKKFKLGKSLRINMLGTEDLLSWIKEWFDKLTPNDIQAKVYKDRENSKIFRYDVTGMRAYVLSKMMLSLPILRLDRKWNKAREWIEIIETIDLSIENLCKLKRMITPGIEGFVNSYNNFFPNFNIQYMLTRLKNNGYKVT